MPIYIYHCPTCSRTFDQLQPIVARGFAHCPDCGTLSPKGIALFNTQPSFRWYTTKDYHFNRSVK